MDDLRAALVIEVERIADRLRGLSQARLTEPVPGHASRADAARSAAQALADAAACIEAGRAADHVGDVDRAADADTDTGLRPARDLHVLPALTVFAAGDQVAVTGHDLIAALAAVPDGEVEPDFGKLARRALEELRTLRRLL